MTAAPVRLTVPVAVLPASPGAPGSIARERLVEMRRDLILRLDGQIDASNLRLLAYVQTSIWAIDAAQGDAAS